MDLDILVTQVTLVITIIGLLWQIQQTRSSQNLDFLWRLEELFRNNSKMLACRRNAAQSLLNNKGTNDLSEIMDFFETIGPLVNKKVLNADLVRSYFFYWAVRYWLTSQSYVAEQRSILNDQQLWSDFESLYHKLLKLQVKHRKYNSVNRVLPSKKDLKEFLIDESKVT